MSLLEELTLSVPAHIQYVHDGKLGEEGKC